MKKTITLFTLLSFLTTPLLRADDYVTEVPTTYADEEEEETLPPGKIVGRAAEDAASEARRRQMRNWGIAAGVVAIGIATLILVNHNHRK